MDVLEEDEDKYLAGVKKLFTELDANAGVRCAYDTVSKRYRRRLAVLRVGWHRWKGARGASHYGQLLRIVSIQL